MTVQPGLCQTWSEPKFLGFLTHMLIFKAGSSRLSMIICVSTVAVGIFVSSLVVLIRNISMAVINDENDTES